MNQVILGTLVLKHNVPRYSFINSILGCDLDLSTQDRIPRVRASGVRDVLVYCRDHRCRHHIEISADRWPDHVRLSDIEPTFTCTACGKRGAEVRPNFAQADMGTG